MRLVRHGGPRAHALFAAALVAAVGVSNTAAFLVPVLVGGLVLAAVATAHWRGALRLVAWTVYPVVMGVLSIVLAPTAATPAQLVAEGFPVGPTSDGMDPVQTVPGGGGMLVVTAVALAVGALGIGDRFLRTGAIGTIVTAGLALLPPVRDVLREVGLWSVVWRMWWAIPVTLLLAGTVGAVAHWTQGRRGLLPQVAVGGAAAAVALVPLIDGQWVGSPVNHSRLVTSLAWKLPRGSLAQAEFIEAHSAPGDVVLVPSNASRALAALTVDVHPVAARAFYLPNYAAEEDAHAGLRAELQRFADKSTPQDPTRLVEGLDVLDVRTACVSSSRGAAVRLLEEQGFHEVGTTHRLTCLQR